VAVLGRSSRWPKRSPVFGAEVRTFHVGKILGARFAGAGLLARFRHVAPLFIQLFLLPAGLTSFLIRLLLLLLARLLPTAALLLVGFSAVLVLLLIAVYVLDPNLRALASPLICFENSVAEHQKGLRRCIFRP
jgi:hypothetical protein